MELKEARSLIGHEATITWLDRKGDATTDTVRIYDAEFVPLYGPCIVTDAGNISLERVQDWIPLAKAA